MLSICSTSSSGGGSGRTARGSSSSALRTGVGVSGDGGGRISTGGDWRAAGRRARGPSLGAGRQRVRCSRVRVLFVRMRVARRLVPRARARVQLRDDGADEIWRRGRICNLLSSKLNFDRSRRRACGGAGKSEQAGLLRLAVELDLPPSTRMRTCAHRQHWQMRRRRRRVAWRSAYLPCTASSSSAAPSGSPAPGARGSSPARRVCAHEEFEFWICFGGRAQPRTRAWRAARRGA